MHHRPSRESLDPAECLRLLETARIGRIIFTQNALPAVRPVSFAVLPAGEHRRAAIIVPVDARSGLDESVRDFVVAFEVDDVDLELQRGWNVTVVGRAELVDDPDKITELSALAFRPWAPSPYEHFFRIDVELIRGARLDDERLDDERLDGRDD